MEKLFFSKELWLPSIFLMRVTFYIQCTCINTYIHLMIIQTIVGMQCIILLYYIIAINNILFLPFNETFFPLSVETNLLKCSHPLKPFMSFLRHTAEILLPPWTCVYRTYKTDECPLSCAAAVGGSDLELSNKEKKMNSKDESSHVWPTSADHDQNTAQVKDGLFQLTVGNSV